MNLLNTVDKLSRVDASIFIAVSPIYEYMAFVGFIICLYATLSRQVCTRGYALAAAIHILLIIWVLLIWQDSARVLPPLVLSVAVRGLLLLVTTILVFSARIAYTRIRLPKRILENKELL